MAQTTTGDLAVQQEGIELPCNRILEDAATQEVDPENWTA